MKPINNSIKAYGEIISRTGLLLIIMGLFADLKSTVPEIQTLLVTIAGASMYIGVPIASMFYHRHVESSLKDDSTTKGEN